MPERIHYTPQSPAVFFPYWKDLGCTSREGLSEDSIRIRDSQDHSNRAAAERLGAEVAMLWRLATHPELRAVHGKSCHDVSVGRLQTKDFIGSECGFVEVDRSRTIPNRQPGCNRAREQSARRWIYDHVPLLSGCDGGLRVRFVGYRNGLQLQRGHALRERGR